MRPLLILKHAGHAGPGLVALASAVLLATGSVAPLRAAPPPVAQRISAATFLEALRQAGPRQTVEFRNAVVEGRVHASSASLDSVRAEIRLRNLTFRDQVTFDGVVFLGPVRIAQSSFDKGTSMLDTRFEQDVSFAKSSFSEHTTFKRAHFASAARFIDITCNGMTSFSDAVFAGEPIDFTRARFLEPAYFDLAVFAAAASFRDAHFELESSFKEARWSGAADFAGARFGEEALFRYARFVGDVTFDRSRFRRAVYFDKARFDETVSFRDITFAREATFARAVFGGDADFARCRFKAAADFSDVTFRAPVHLNAYFGRALILRRATGPLADLRSIPEDAAAESADSTFADTARVYLQSADFGRMLVRWSQLQGRLAATDTTDVAALEGSYGSVRRHLSDLGMAADARAAYREWMERRRQALPVWQVERLWLEVFAVTTRYGTDPVRLLLWALGVVLLFALLFRRLSSSFASTVAPAGEERLQGFLPALYLSLCVFLRVGVPWRPAGAARPWVVAEAVVGWLFLAGLIAMAVRLLSP